MEASHNVIGMFVERRCSSTFKRSSWNEFSTTQKRTTKSLLNFGFKLTYFNTKKLVFMVMGKSIVTVSDSGDVCNFSKAAFEEIELYKCDNFNNEC
jgi:hypothetical protein